MGSARDPDGGPGRDGEKGDAAEALAQAGYGTADPVGEGFYDESDGAVPYDVDPDDVDPVNVDPGYFDDAGGPVESFFAPDQVAAIRESVVAREEERFGGIKIGAAFFGWLTATAMSVLLAAVVTAAGKAGLLTGTDLITGAGQTSSSLGSGTAGAILVLAISLLAYFAGGYVAGRMARFNGIGQGLMVWLWGVIVSAAVALLAVVGGGQFNVLATLNSFLRLPGGDGQITTSGVIAAIAVAAIALMGAVLGGIAGVHYHRKVDGVGFAPAEEYYQP